MRKFRTQAIVNLVIIMMLLCLSIFAFNTSNNYVFSYNNNDVIYKGNTNSNNVSLMVNVYWGNEYLQDMLRIFKDYGVKTTFFVGGTWVNKYPELLKQIHNDGHEIANHGYFHKDQDKLNYQQNYEEIYVTHELVKGIINVEMNLFAPPSGAFNNSTIDSASKLGYKVIMWSRDTIDWRDKDDDLIYSRATKNTVGGDLILMHPTENTVIALPKILNSLKEKKLNITTVTNTLK